MMDDAQEGEAGAQEVGITFSLTVNPAAFWRAARVMKLALASEAENGAFQLDDDIVIGALVNVLRALKGVPLPDTWQWLLDSSTGEMGFNFGDQNLERTAADDDQNAIA